jgi:hypothetical protein
LLLKFVIRTFLLMLSPHKRTTPRNPMNLPAALPSPNIPALFWPTDRSCGGDSLRAC